MVRRFASDEGFSLVEVMFAAFIAFFVLTAVFGMLVVSTREGRVASTDEIATQLAQVCVEQARAMAYADVGIVGGTGTVVAGTLPSSETTVFQSITFTISRNVTWVDDPANNSQSGDVTHDYKQLTVQIDWSGGGHITPVVTYIREHKNDMPDPPNIEWVTQPGALSPYSAPVGTVLFNRSSSGALLARPAIWAGSWTVPDGSLGPASMNASASVSSTTGAIARMTYDVDGRVFWDHLDSQAQVTWPSTAQDVPLSMVDTASVAFFPDGIRIIRVTSYTTAMAYASRVAIVTVDNFPPMFPGGATVSLLQPSSNQRRYYTQYDTTFTPASDAAPFFYDRDPARHYDVGLISSTAFSSGIATSTFTWQNIGTTGAAVAIGAGLPAGWTPQPFTAYRIALTGRSMRGLSGGGTIVSPWTASTPQLNGTATDYKTSKKGTSDFRFNLTISPPTSDLATLFGGTGAVVRYDIYTATAYSGSGDLLSPTTYALDQLTPAFQVTLGTTYTRYVQVVARVEDAGGNTVYSISSNVLGPPTSTPPWGLTDPKPSVPLTIP